MAKVCGACNKDNDETAKFCRSCGKAFAGAAPITPIEQPKTVIKQCPSCQKANKESAKFCLSCGYSLATAPLPSPVITTPVVPLAPQANVAPPQDVLARTDEVLASPKRPPVGAPSVPRPSSPEHSALVDITSKPASAESPMPLPRQEVMSAKVTPLRSDRPTQPSPPLPQPRSPQQGSNDARRKPSMGEAAPVGPPETNKGKLKLVIIAAGAIVIVAVVAGGAYWYLNKSKDVPTAETTQTTPASAPIAAPTPALEPAPTANQPAQSSVVQEAEPQKPDAQSQQVAPANPINPRLEPSVPSPSPPAAAVPEKPVGQAIAPIAAPKPLPPRQKPLVEKAKRQEPPPPVQDSKKSAEDLRKQIEDELRGITRK